MQREVDTSCAIKRTSVPAIDGILGNAFPVLDHGFIRLIDYMGDDQAIVDAARVSYGEGTKHVSNTYGLVNYLMRHHHSSPFEMCELKLHVKLPILVARQWIRHRMANVNEYSARYSIMEREFYIPEPEQIAKQSTTNNQGRGEIIDQAQALNMIDWIRNHSELSYNLYENQLDEGMARELARMNLPVNIYTQWYWKVDLHNLLHFLRLRADPHAQYEIRVYADEILRLIKQWVPHAVEAFEIYTLNAVSFSTKEQAALAQMIAPEANYDAHGMSTGEQREFKAKLDKLLQPR